MADESKYPTRIAPYGLRIPPGLKERIASAAEANARSLHSEIIHTLEAAYPAPVEGQGLEEVRKLIFNMVALIPPERYPHASRDIDNWLEKNGYPYSFRIDLDDKRKAKSFRLVPRKLSSPSPDDG